MNPYQVLGIPQDASDEEIKIAYRKLVKEYHPDRNSSESAKVIIVRVNEAHEILSDPLKRARYDQPAQPVYYNTQSNEERIYEEKKKAYRQRQREREIREEERRKIKEERYFKVGKVIAVPILVFASLLIIDQLLPENHYQGPAETGWQQSLGKHGRTYLSYMVTREFMIGVPNEVHVGYDYYGNPGQIRIEATPIFNIPKTVQVDLAEGVAEFEAKRTVYSFLLPLHYCLFLTSLFVVTRKEYSPLYHLSGFLATLFLVIVLMNMYL
jgi:hypothetical protein